MRVKKIDGNVDITDWNLESGERFEKVVSFIGKSCVAIVNDTLDLIIEDGILIFSSPNTNEPLRCYFEIPLNGELLADPSFEFDIRKMLIEDFSDSDDNDKQIIISALRSLADELETLASD